MNRWWRWALVTGVVLGIGCADGPQVTQGTVVQVDSSARVLVVRDERPPNEEVSFDFATAEIGAEPKPGDLVRLAWKERDGRKVASRIMNLSKQEEGKAGVH